MLLPVFQMNISHFAVHFPFFCTAQKSYSSLTLGVPSELCQPDLSKHIQVSFWEIYTHTSYQRLSEGLHHYGISYSERLRFMKLWIARIRDLPLFIRLSAFYIHSFDLFYIIKSHQGIAKINLLTLDMFV